MSRINEYFANVDWGTLLTVWGMRLVSAIVVLLLGLWLARMLANGVKASLGRAHFDEMLSDFLRRIVYSIALVLVFVTVLSQLGMQVTSLLAVLGAAGLAIGLALRDSLANIAAGVVLIALRPFRRGDVVLIAGQEGLIEEVGIFQTVIKTFSNHHVTLPNSQITSSPIVNYTALGQRRVDVPVGISYDADIREAREALLAIAEAHELTLDEPAPSVMVTNLGDSSVDLTLRAYVNTPDFASTRSELLEAIHSGFGKAGIGIPYPQRDVHLKLPEGVELPRIGPKSASNEESGARDA